MADLTTEQKKRYERNIVLPNFGTEGQQRLLNAKALVVGTGGLGSPCAYYLAAAGIGTLGLADDDVVDLSNLNRQILHSTETLGARKTASAAARIKALNPDCTIVEHSLRIDEESIAAIIGDYDIVLDGTDNFPARFVMNDACVKAGKPYIHAGVFQYEGQVMTVVPGQGPCYRCLFPEAPPEGLIPSGAEAGILGSVPGAIGAIEATEAIKLIVGLGEPLIGRLLTFDLLSMTARTVVVPRDLECLVCSSIARS